MEPFKGKEPTATPANFSYGPRFPKKITYHELYNSYKPRFQVAVGNVVADVRKYKVGVCIKTPDGSNSCTIQLPSRKHHVALLANCVGVSPKNSFVKDSAGCWYQVSATQTKVCVLLKLYSLKSNRLQDNGLDSNGEEEFTAAEVQKMFEDSSDDADEQTAADSNSNGATGTSTSQHRTSTSTYHTCVYVMHCTSTSTSTNL